MRDSIHHLKSNMDFGYAIKPIMLNQIKNGFHHADKEIPIDVLDEQSLEKVEMDKECIPAKVLECLDPAGTLLILSSVCEVNRSTIRKSQ